LHDHFYFWIFFGYLYRRYRRTRKARTVLILEVTSSDDTLQWTVLELPHTAGFYQIDLTPLHTVVSFEVTVCRMQLRYFEHATATHTTLDNVTELPTSIYVNLYDICRLRRILSRSHSVALQVVNGITDELVEVITYIQKAPRHGPAGGALNVLYPVSDTFNGF